MMKRHKGGKLRHFTHSDNTLFGGDRHGHHGHRHRGPHGHPGGGHHRGGEPGMRRGRLFDYGELRMLVLALIADEPHHGYELIKGIEERFGGAYSPSPGVIYPTLSWLNDMGYADAAAEAGGRKRYSITAEGQAFLAANRGAVDALLARAGGGAPEEGGTEEGHRGRRFGRHGVPNTVMKAMDSLKLALRSRLRAGDLDEAALQRIADTIEAAAREVEAGR